MKITLSFAILAAVAMTNVRCLASPPAPPAKTAAGRAFANVSMKDVVATVSKRSLTGRDTLEEFMELEPAQAQDFLAKRYPNQNLTTPPDLSAYWKYACAEFPGRLRTIIGYLMVALAVEETAAQRGIQISDSDVQAKVHADLETRRRSADLPEGMTDAQIATHFGDTMPRLNKTIRRLLLMDRLILADLEDRLGHPIGPEDFFSAHLIYVTAGLKPGGAPGELDLAGAKAKIEAARADILAQKTTFEETAKKISSDGSAYGGGRLPPMPRTFLKTAAEMELLRCKPGELTPPVLNQDGYMLFRLDKAGAQLSEAERRSALRTYLLAQKRRDDAIARQLKEVQWTTNLGETPSWLKPPIPMPTPAN